VGNALVVHGSKPNFTSQSLSTATAANFLGVWGDASGAAYVVGAGGAIRAATLPYTSLAPEQSGTNKQLHAIWALPSPAAPCAAWAVGETGTILCKAYP